MLRNVIMSINKVGETYEISLKWRGLGSTIGEYNNYIQLRSDLEQAAIDKGIAIQSFPDEKSGNKVLYSGIFKIKGLALPSQTMIHAKTRFFSDVATASAQRSLTVDEARNHFAEFLSPVDNNRCILQ